MIDGGVAAFAFAAGAVAAFNPCGAAMLPGYLALLLRAPGDGTPAPASPSGRLMTIPLVSRVLQGMGLGLWMTLGFLGVFAIAGAVVAAAGQLLRAILPPLTVIVGVGLMRLGVLTLLDRSPSWLGGFAVAPAGPSIRAARLRFVPALGYGAAYAVASLGCTLPVFLAAVAQALGRGTVATVAVLFAYGLGMGLVVTVLSVTVAAARERTEAWLRAGRARFKVLAGLLLLGSGSYVAYYWLWGPGHLLRSFL